MFGKYGKYHGGDVYSVWLAENAFTPADATFEIGVISAIPEVKRLAVGNVSPSALSKLSKMPRLESLTIESGPINDDDLECLAGSPHLQRLDLPSAELTSRGMATIGSRTKLTSLDLTRSSLDDAGFAHFASLPLQELSLKQSNTSDAAIPYLAQLKGLKELNIEYTNITEDGVQRLLRGLPQCKIEHDYPWLD
jgi:hypothetical protein